MDIFNLSRDAADAVYGAANVLTILGAVLAFVGAAGVFWSGGVRERYSDERIARNEAEAALANEAAAVARLETERLRQQMAWRRLTSEQHKALVGALKGSDIELWNMFVGHDPESQTYRRDLDAAFAEAGVKTKYYSGWEVAVGLQVTHVPSAAFDLLTRALQTAGISYTLKEPKGNEGITAELGILVGTKPPLK